MIDQVGIEKDLRTRFSPGVSSCEEDDSTAVPEIIQTCTGFHIHDRLRNFQGECTWEMNLASSVIAGLFWGPKLQWSGEDSGSTRNFSQILSPLTRRQHLVLQLHATMLQRNLAKR